MSSSASREHERTPVPDASATPDRGSRGEMHGVHLGHHAAPLAILTEREQYHDHAARHTLAPAEPSLEERLDASLVPPDRVQFQVALKVAASGWAFYGAASACVVWLSSVVWGIGVPVAAVFAIMLGALAVRPLIKLAVSLPLLFARVLRASGRRGYGWFVLTLVVAALDVAVYAGCLLWIGRAADWWAQLR
jgi:hypothetical protein